MSVASRGAADCFGDAATLLHIRDKARTAFGPLFELLDEQRPQTGTGKVALSAFGRELRMHLRFLDSVADGLNDMGNEIEADGEGEW